MKAFDLKHGMVLVQTLDVKNPKPDRRQTRHWFAEPTWSRGRLFYVSTYDYVTLQSGYGRVTANTPGFDALVDVCEPAERTLETILYALTHARTLVGYQDELLEVLVETGKLSLDAVEGAIAIIREREKKD